MLYKYDVKNERWSIVGCTVSKNNDFRRRDKITCRVFWINYFPLCAIYATDTRLILPSLCDNYKLSCQGNIDAFRVREAFPKLFYICGTGHGHEVDGWKGLKMVAKGSDRWLMKALQPATTFGSTHQDRPLPSNTSLSRVCETSTRLEFPSICNHLRCPFDFFSFPLLPQSVDTLKSSSPRYAFYENARVLKFHLLFRIDDICILNLFLFLHFRYWLENKLFL